MGVEEVVSRDEIAAKYAYLIAENQGNTSIEADRECAKKYIFEAFKELERLF